MRNLVHRLADAYRRSQVKDDFHSLQGAMHSPRITHITLHEFCFAG